VIHDLAAKLKAHPEATKTLYSAVCGIYDCGEPAGILTRHGDIATLDVGLPPDQLLYTIKWLFIEQDVTYWLQTGRDMLMGAIEVKVFGIEA
jgi:hypothetical protein